MEFNEKIAPGRAAVLVVDLQNDFCHPNGAYAKLGTDPDLARMLEALKWFLSAARERKVPVLFVHTIYNRWTVSPVIEEWWAGLGIERLCAEGSWGAEFYGIQPKPVDRVVNKYRPSGFMETDLDLTLRAKEIESLLLAGIGVWGGLFETARDALAKNYYAILLEDCVSGGLKLERTASIDLFRRYYREVATSEKVVDAWKRRAEGR